MNLLRHMPNALTLINLALGTLAIFALSNDLVQMALMLMGGCLLADALDGAIARKLGVAGKSLIGFKSIAKDHSVFICDFDKTVGIDLS